MSKLIKNIVVIVFAPIGFILLWSFLAPLYSLPNIKSIYLSIGGMINDGTYFHDILISSIRALSGFIIGFALGSFTGILTGRYTYIFRITGGLLMFLRWTPVLAIVPLTIRIGGLGEGPKIFLVAWACFFLSWIYTHIAANKLNNSYLWWSKSLGLTTGEKIHRIFIPAIAPSLIGTARACLAIALIVVVAAELSGAYQSGFFREGLGYRISRAIETGQDSKNIACIATFGMIGILYDTIFVLIIKSVLSPLTGINYYRDAD